MKFSLPVLALAQLITAHGFEKIESYTPRSLVTDAAAIDLDLHAITKELSKEDKSGWSNAENMYRQGANSKPVAKLVLDHHAAAAFDEGTKVVGTATDGSVVTGQLFSKVKANAHHIEVQYDISEEQSNYVRCQVGANPDPNVDGCFASTGNITVSDISHAYNYDVNEGNVNYRNIADFSNGAEEKMYKCDNCPYPYYQKQYDYFGEFNYADRIITKAFRGEETDLKNGNMDFSIYTEYGKSQIIHKSMVYLSIVQYSVRQMEQAVAECEKGRFEEGAHFWDEAVAYYTGSRAAEPNNHGDLMFHQAEIRCKEFNTCSEESNSLKGQSFVSFEVFTHFQEGQGYLLNNKCDAARKNKERIVTMMTIPLIQGTLRYAHIIAHEDKFYEKHSAEGATFALSVLPLVHACNAHDAKVIYENMKTKDDAVVDYVAVKAAFEKNYDCLNVKCNEIGGIWDATLGDYKPDAYPCGVEESSIMAAVIGGVVGSLALIACVALYALRRKRNVPEPQSEGVFKDNPDPQGESGFKDRPEDDFQDAAMGIDEYTFA